MSMHTYTSIHTHACTCGYANTRACVCAHTYMYTHSLFHYNYMQLQLQTCSSFIKSHTANLNGNLSRMKLCKAKWFEGCDNSYSISFIASNLMVIIYRQLNIVKRSVFQLTRKVIRLVSYSKFRRTIHICFKAKPKFVMNNNPMEVTDGEEGITLIYFVHTTKFDTML